MIKAGIAGGMGYVAGELTRLLINHPDVILKGIYCPQQAGNRVDTLYQGVLGETELTFTDHLDLETLDVLFMCCTLGESRAFVAEHELPATLKVIDLSPDYRISGEEHDFVYGLPELNRKRIVNDCTHVACPGGYSTAISLALLPLARNLMLNSDLHVCAIKGSTGTGSSDRNDWDYSKHNNNMSVYKPFVHEQLAEVKQVLGQMQNSFKSEINFVPMRGPFARGVIASVYLDCNVDIDVLNQLYNEYYSDHSFTYVVNRQPDLKDVVNTNKCLLHLERVGHRLIITSVIDNLLKGAAGTAVHCMNLLFGLTERTGLMLKASAV